MKFIKHAKIYSFYIKSSNFHSYHANFTHLSDKNVLKIEYKKKVLPQINSIAQFHSFFIT